VRANDELTIIVDPIISHKWLFKPYQNEPAYDVREPSQEKISMEK